MSADRDLGRRLRDVSVPGETEAEQRSWEVVRTAYAERTPLRPAHSVRRWALAVAGGAVLLAIGLSPAGAKVGDLAENMAEAVGIGEEDAKPALRSLPAAGELLVESEQGPWIVREDGSKRLLGDYGEASWSQPRGLYVAVTDGRQLLAVNPVGQVRWTIAAPAPVADPRWSPSGFRVAYRAGDDLWVVNGDGIDERLVARDVAPVAPAWRTLGDAKTAPGGVGSHVLSYVTADQDVRTVDVDTETSVPTTDTDLELLTTPSSGQRVGPAASPDGTALAAVRPVRGGTELVLRREGVGRPEVLFTARGALTGPTWSPDGHWLLVGLPRADQWIFIRADRPGRVVAFDDISEQFDPGGTGAGAFPRVSGWILPQR